MKVDVLAMLDSFAEAAFFSFEETRIKEARQVVAELIEAAKDLEEAFTNMRPGMSGPERHFARMALINTRAALAKVQPLPAIGSSLGQSPIG